MRLIPALAVVLLTSSPLRAQKAPEVGYAFPPVVRAGTTATVQLGGYDLTRDTQFFVHHRDIHLKTFGPPGKFLVPDPPYWFGEKARGTAFPIPREVTAQIKVPRNVKPGLVRWQAANANGASGTAVFFVSDGPEVVENRDRDKPQELKSLPVAVSGRIRKIAEFDRYRFTVKKSGPVTIELFARRLGSNFHGVLKVRDDAGERIADVADTQGRDAALTFFAKAGRSYTVALHDVDFRGNRAFVYRLAFTPGPHVLTTIPAFGRRGATRVVEFIGYGLATGKARLETVRQKVAIPIDTLQSTFRYRLQTPFGVTPPVTIPLSDLTEMAASPSNNQPIPQAVPSGVTAMLKSTNGNAHIFKAKKGETLRVEALSRGIGTRLDLSLSIRNANGKQLASNDDLPGTPDAGLNFKAPADGEYAAVVTDLAGPNRGPRVYRLAIGRAKPGFALNAPQSLKIPMDGKQVLTVKATRHGGFRGEIKLSIHGLPAAITVSKPLAIPAGKNSAKITFTRAKKSGTQAALIRITGRATIDGKTVVQPVRAVAAGNLAPRDPQSNRTDAILLATTMKPPFALELIDKNRQRAVHRGTTYRAEFLIKRDAGFKGDVLLMMAAKQGRHRQGIRGPIVTAGPQSERVLYPCFMPEWLETDRTTRMVVLGAAMVADSSGRIRYITKPANARITMILEGALLKVSHRAKELTVKPGGRFEIPVTILRSAKLKLPVTVRLVPPRVLAGAIQCRATTIASDKSQATLFVQTSDHDKLRGRWTFQVTATAMQQGKWPVVSQTEVVVQFDR